MFIFTVQIIECYFQSFFMRKIFLIIAAVAMSNVFVKAQDDAMMQVFYWDVPVDGENKNGFWYDSISAKIPELKKAGFREFWMPPPSKGNWGIYDMGYGVHDHYDLGAYEQIGTTSTRFGSIDELKRLIKLAHDTANGPRINLLADVLLNHMYSTQEKDLEANPVLLHYINKEAWVNGNEYFPYPLNEIIWKITTNGSTNIKLIHYQAGFGSDWDGTLFIKSDTTIAGLNNYRFKEPATFSERDCISNPGWYAVQFNGDTLVLDIKNPQKSEQSYYLNIAFRTQSSQQNFNWIDQTRGLRIIPDIRGENSTNINVLTTTGVKCASKDTLPNLKWDYSFFHPGFEGDLLHGDLVDDKITPELKWFGHDFNHKNPTLLEYLSDWGKWLRDSIGFDGYRLDFIVGVEEQFIADWINEVWKDGPNQEGTMVAEYFTKNKKRIGNWISFMEAETSEQTQLKAFDFPLKFELTEMCNDTAQVFDMRNLLHAGMLFNSEYKLDADQLVSFVDNHDTGKESDKWLTKDWNLAYAYIFFYPAQPCVFYNHYFGDTQYEFGHSDKAQTLPAELGAYIDILIASRKHYLGGEMMHLTDSSEKYKNFYLAFREGNESCSGAFLSISNAINNSQHTIMLPKQYTAFYGEELINLLDPGSKVTVAKNGEVVFNIRSAGRILKDEVKE
jgi:alpha-amylase